MLPDWIRKQMIGVASQWLKDTCTLSVETQAQDEYGGITPGTAVVATGIPCRVIMAGASANSAVDETAGQETFEQMYWLEVPQDTALDSDQSVVVAGVSYQIVRIETALTDRFFRSALMVRR